LVGALLQTTWLGTAVTVAVGLTVIVKVAGVPVQVVPALLKEGVTVIVAVTGAVPVLVAVKDGMIFPEPLAARPMEVFVFVQL
jgi:hypothetical protein